MATDWLGLVAAAAGGGGVGALAQVYIGQLKAKQEIKRDDQDFIREGFELAVKVVTDQRNDALESLKEVRRELADMQLEIVGLKLANSFDPFPRWMVDLEGRYIYTNACFEEKYLEPRGMLKRDIIGQTHEALWPPEVCSKIRQLDGQARSRPDGRARAVLILQEEEATLYKFPVRVQGVVVAYAGYIMEHS